MKLTTRKLTVLLAIVLVPVLANALAIVTWLDRSGVLGFAQFIRRQYLTGTAITVIAVMLFLAAEPIGMATGWIKRCRVCRHLLLRQSSYCGRCGSRL